MKPVTLALALVVGTGSLVVEREAAAFELRRLIPRIIRDRFQRKRPVRYSAETSQLPVVAERKGDVPPAALSSDSRRKRAHPDTASSSTLSSLSLPMLVDKANAITANKTRTLQRFIRDLEPLHEAIGAAMDLIGSKELNLFEHTREIPLIFKREGDKVSVHFAGYDYHRYRREAENLTGENFDEHGLTFGSVSAGLKKTIVKLLSESTVDKTVFDETASSQPLAALTRRAKKIAAQKAEAERARQRAVETFVDGLEPLHKAIHAAMDLTGSHELDLFEHTRSVPLIFERDQGKITVHLAEERDYNYTDGNDKVTLTPARFERHALTVDTVSAGLKLTLVRLLPPGEIGP
jgi:hypothetical protein